MTETLEPILDAIHTHLQHGAMRRDCPMHTPVVGTADGDLRVMVLREFDLARRTLRFHTDGRSPKVAAIRANPSVTVLFYDPAAKVQIRVSGVGHIETTSAAANAAWEHAAPFAKRCYLAEAAPGCLSDSPVSGLPEWAEGVKPTAAQAAPGRKNFALVMVRICAFDWLHLANSGHRRARFEFSAEGTRGNWLVP